MIQNSYDNSPTLYLVPTPIGNFSDMTLRGIEVLKSVDYILCEDTRTSTPLLKHYEISKPLISCHEFNEEKIEGKILSLLKDGKNLALITDQGSPVINDPGYIISKFAIQNGFNVVGLPGATAIVPALMMSGLNPNRFLYYGFLNVHHGKRVDELKSIANYPFSIIFYEAPHRIIDTLNDMKEVLGDREIAVAREISKIHEEVVRGKISEVLENLPTIKGEYVIICSGNYEKEDYSSLSIYDHVLLYLNDMKEMDAIKKVAKERGVPKSVVYKEYTSKKRGEER